MRAVKTAISDSMVIRNESDNVLYAYNPAILIFEDGQIWEVLVNAFVAREEIVFQMWAETPELFTRRATVQLK